MALYLMGDISTYVRKINVAIIERPLKEKLGLAGALVFALVRFLVDITMYLGWFTRQVELTSLPAIQQVRLQEIRDQPWAHALRVLWVLLLVALAATAAALLISPLFVTKLP